MEKIYRIFVSSTYEDLREERAEVQKALLKLKCLPVGMELFPSTDDETWEFIKRQIDASDYYLLIIGGRYGSLAADGVSFTEKEYDYARSVGKPSIAFVHGDRGELKASRTELDHEKREKLEAFIAKVRSGPLVQSFTTPHELSGQVLVSMVDLRERRPAVGFIRSNEIVEAKKYADLLEENARLRAELLAISNKVPNIFFGADEKYVARIQVAEKGSNNGVPVEKEFAASWKDIFKVVADNLITSAGCTDYMMSSSVLALSCEDTTRVSVGFCAGEFEEIKKFLYARQLVSFDTATKSFGSRPVQRSYHVWRLTEYGREQYSAIYGVYSS